MKNLLFPILLLANISLIAQSNTQVNEGKKIKSHTQAKGGCRVTFNNDSVKVALQANASQFNIQVTWNNNLNITGPACICWAGQILERQVGNNSYDTISLGLNATSYIDTSILTGIAYNYRLWRRVPCAGFQFTIYSDTITAQTVGVKEKVAPISKIYPIPANNFLFLETDQRLVGEPFSIINVTGSTVIKGIISSSKMKLNIEELPQGFYFIRVNESVKKLIVNK